MQTLGSLVDQLGVVNLKMWNAQEFLYKIRKMSEDEFIAHYSESEHLKELYTIFQKSCDLNVQRNNIIDEIDSFLVELVTTIQNGENVDIDKLTQRKHKTY